MTGFAQVKGQVNDQTAFTLSLKSVNHRFLDLHFRMPSESDGLEMKLRRLLKEKLARGHIEITLSIDRAGGDGFELNRETGRRIHSGIPRRLDRIWPHGRSGLERHLAPAGGAWRKQQPQ